MGPARARGSTRLILTAPACRRKRSPATAVIAAREIGFVERAVDELDAL
jgi:hypothetical protein